MGFIIGGLLYGSARWAADLGHSVAQVRIGLFSPILAYAAAPHCCHMRNREGRARAHALARRRVVRPVRDPFHAHPVFFGPLGVHAGCNLQDAALGGSSR